MVRGSLLKNQSRTRGQCLDLSPGGYLAGKAFPRDRSLKLLGLPWGSPRRRDVAYVVSKLSPIGGDVGALRAASGLKGNSVQSTCLFGWKNVS